MTFDDDIRKQAMRRLKAKRDFWTFIGVWAAVTALLVAIWFFSSGPDTYFWPLWPILGMGIAALFVGLDAYGPGRRFITESDIDAEVRRMTKRPDDSA
jgi:hypothetical protein